MKLLSYGLDHRMEPRLAFSLKGYAVDVMRASLWMKAERNALDYLSLPSSMRLALEDWPRTLDLIHELTNTFQNLDLATLVAYDRPVAVVESDIAFFAPVPDPPTLRLFQAFDQKQGFDFGNTQTLLGHLQPCPLPELLSSAEIAAIIANSRAGLNPEIAGYCIANNWIDTEAEDADTGARRGSATSLGPYLITADELEGHKMGLGFSLELVINKAGTTVEANRLKDMKHSFQDMIDLARRTNIQAGDIFLSGSPGSVSVGSPVDIESQVLGTLSTPAVSNAE